MPAPIGGGRRGGSAQTDNHKQHIRGVTCLRITAVRSSLVVGSALSPARPAWRSVCPRLRAPRARRGSQENGNRRPDHPRQIRRHDRPQRQARRDGDPARAACASTTHTPKEILFNRFHFPHEGNAAWYATTGAPGRDGQELDIADRRPGTTVARVTIADLQKMPQEKRVSVLQCAGNGRSFYAAKQKVAGGQWKNGGMGNVEWEGVPLQPFLADLKMEPAASVRWLTAGRLGPAGDAGRLRLRQELPPRRSGARPRHPRAQDERRADPGGAWRAGAPDHPGLSTAI